MAKKVKQMNQVQQVEPEIKPDKFRIIKHLAYCRSKGPLDGMTTDEFVVFAKTTLCILTSRLYKDPVWDRYSKEEILIEFFSHKFAKDPNFVKEFELSLSGHEIDDFGAWADHQMNKEAILREKAAKDTDDKVSFSPDDVMGGV